MKKRQYCIIKTTFPDKKSAKNLIKILLDQKLIACAQISKVDSLYFWENKIQEEKEYQISLKTVFDHYHEIEKIIIKNHSYKVPQIIKIAIEDGSKDYLDWILNSVKG